MQRNFSSHCGYYINDVVKIDIDIGCDSASLESQEMLRAHPITLENVARNSQSLIDSQYVLGY